MDINFRFASASVSDRGLSEKRPVNEDSFIELRELGLFAVADGVGGAQAGDFASQMAMETLGEAFNNLPENFDAEQALRITILYTDVDWTTPRLLVFGSEAHGLEEGELDLIDEKVLIPMENEVESLNLAISSGIILFEAKRQRIG